MGTIQDDFQKHGTVCVCTDCWKRWWTMGVSSLQHSLRHLPLHDLVRDRSFLWINLCKFLFTSSTCSVIGCPFFTVSVSNSSARSWTKSVVSNRAKMFISFATWFSFSTQILFSFLRSHLHNICLVSLRQTGFLVLICTGLSSALLLLSMSMTGEILHLIHKRYPAFSKFRKKKDVSWYRKFSYLRNQVQYKKKQVKSDFIANYNKTDEFKQQPKQVWQLLKSLGMSTRCSCKPGSIGLSIDNKIMFWQITTTLLM